MAKSKQTIEGLERAKRIRRLRNVLRYSRPKFAQKYAHLGITASGLQGWEDSIWNGLRERGAKLLAEAFQAEGIPVTMEWLMFGTGKDPLENWSFIPTSLKKSLPLSANLNPTFLTRASEILPSSQAEIFHEKGIQQELQFYHQLYPGSVDAIVSDNTMLPVFEIGDYVAGKRYFGKDIEQAIGRPSITQTKEGKLLIRMVRAGKEIGLYNLENFNKEAQATDDDLKNVELFSAAPIDWIRKKPK